MHVVIAVVLVVVLHLCNFVLSDFARSSGTHSWLANDMNCTSRQTFVSNDIRDIYGTGNNNMNNVFYAICQFHNNLFSPLPFLLFSSFVISSTFHYNCMTFACAHNMCSVTVKQPYIG